MLTFLVGTMNPYSGPYALFSGGGPITKYFFANKTMQFKAVGMVGSTTNNIASAGNSQQAIFTQFSSSPSPVAEVRKWTYAQDSSAFGTNLSTSFASPVGCGSTSAAIVGGGFLTVGNTAATNKYQYSNDAVSISTALGLARRPSTVGNTQVGIFAGGMNGYVDKYTFATDVRVPSTVIPLERSGMGGAGNQAQGVFMGGADNSGSNKVNSFLYASETWVDRQPLASGFNGASGAARTEDALFGAWFNANQASNLYTFSNDTYTTGVSLQVASNSNIGATSQAQQGF